MALTTFGAIMTFAAEMVRQTEEVYRSAVQKARDPALGDVLKELLAEEGKNRSLMERTRREHVTEMILEPISGLDQEAYEIKPGSEEQAGDADLLRDSVAREETEARFFRDCSAKIPLPEVAGIFRKIARKKDANIARLKGFKLG
jgi:rubrerythrin